MAAFGMRMNRSDPSAACAVPDPVPHRRPDWLRGTMRVVDESRITTRKAHDDEGEVRGHHVAGRTPVPVGDPDVDRDDAPDHEANGSDRLRGDRDHGRGALRRLRALPQGRSVGADPAAAQACAGAAPGHHPKPLRARLRTPAARPPSALDRAVDGVRRRSPRRVRRPARPRQPRRGPPVREIARRVHHRLAHLQREPESTPTRSTRRRRGSSSTVPASIRS